MFFLSKAQLKLEEYLKALQTASLVTSSAINKTFKYSKQKKLLDQLLEIMASFLDSITPEDLIYVAVSIHEQIFSHLHKLKISSNPIQVSSKTIDGEDNDVNGDNNDEIANPNPEETNEFTKNVFDLIQRFFLFAFSLILQRGNGDYIGMDVKEWIATNKGVFEILKECFAYYYPLYNTNYTDGLDRFIPLDQSKFDSNRLKKDTKPNTNQARRQIEDLNFLGFALLDIRIHKRQKWKIKNHDKEGFLEALSDCISFCKKTRFWGGYIKVLKRCSAEMRWKEIDGICHLRSPEIVGELGLLNSKNDCIRIIDHLQQNLDTGKLLVKK